MVGENPQISKVFCCTRSFIVLDYSKNTMDSLRRHGEHIETSKTQTSVEVEENSCQHRIFWDSWMFHLS